MVDPLTGAGGAEASELPKNGVYASCAVAASTGPKTVLSMQPMLGPVGPTLLPAWASQMQWTVPLASGMGRKA